MCPAHRSEKLKEIKAALTDGPCRVVATTVVEAGVDIDFPAVYRIMAGLDSIAQAAGRCNREGRRSAEESIVQLFEIEGRKPIPELRKFEETAREILRQPKFTADPLSLDAIDAYFGFLYWRQEERLDWSERWPLPHNKGAFITRMNEGARALELPFADVDHAFRMIETGMEPVIVPYDGEARKLIEELRDTDRVRDIARKLQPYTVNVPRGTFTVLRGLGRLQPINKYRFKDRFMALTEEAKTALYRKEDGFDFSDPAYQGVENLIF
jgi:CRISPR-associated endonuclease/helicase Cas3